MLTQKLSTTAALCHSARCLGIDTPDDVGRWFCAECDAGAMRCCLCGEFGAGRPDCSLPGLQPVRKCLQGACGRFMHMV